MRRVLRRTVFIIFGNTHKTAESLFWHLKKVWSYGKNREMYCFLISFELKTACFSQSSSVKNGTLRAFLRKRENLLLKIQTIPHPPEYPV